VDTWGLLYAAFSLIMMGEYASREAARPATGLAESAVLVGGGRAHVALFAQTDEVAIAATSNALTIAPILEPHVRRVVLVNPKAVREKAARRAKTDRIDARLLARPPAVWFLARVWTPDEATRARRWLISRRGAPVRRRTREKNQNPRRAASQPGRTRAGQRPVRRAGPPVAGRAAAEAAGR
jgi:transposase